MPLHNGLGLHQKAYILPIRPDSAQADPECPIPFGEPWLFLSPLKHGKLLSKGKILQFQGANLGQQLTPERPNSNEKQADDP